MICRVVKFTRPNTGWFSIFRSAIGRLILSLFRSRAEAEEKISKTLTRRSKAFQAPAVALSAGCTGCRRVFRGKILGTPSTRTVLSGRLAQRESETTRNRRPCGNISRQDDPASSYTCLSNSAKC